MDFTGRYPIPAPPQAVWNALLDPAILKACIPGCERLEKVSDSEFAATATLKIGPMKATFKGNVTLSQMEPPHRLILTGEGQGGVAGFAKGEAEVLLEAQDGGTLLSYTAKANVGGKLAQIGQRLIDGVARQIADDFFSRFSAAIVPPLAADPTTEELTPTGLTTAESTPEPALAPPANREGLGSEIWIVGLIAVVVILLLLFGVVL